ncbi:MAG: hypothetical protein ACRD4M_06775, partial [Candidatus Acidiferrales bacterium]
MEHYFEESVFSFSLAACPISTPTSLVFNHLRLNILALPVHQMLVRVGEAMNSIANKLKTSLGSIVEKAKVRKGLILTLGAFVVLQAYFVRELLAAEALF